MKDQIIKIKTLVNKLIQRNEELVNENKLLKKKITELEESVIDLSKISSNQNDANDRILLRQKMDQYISELDKCINKTQALIANKS